MFWVSLILVALLGGLLIWATAYTNRTDDERMAQFDAEQGD